jgi:hypothetical protein
LGSAFVTTVATLVQTLTVYQLNNINTMSTASGSTITAAQLAARIQAIQKKIKELKALNKKGTDQVKHYEQLIAISNNIKDPLKIPPPRKFKGE